MLIEIETWIAAIDSGFATYSDLEPWAEKRILEAAEPSIWLADLNVAQSNLQALEALWDGWQRIAKAKARNISQDDLDIIGLHLGFLYLRYERGDLNTNDLLRFAGIKADSANYQGPDCEEFYALMYEEYSNPESIEPLADRVRELFAPFAKEARIRYKALI